eukprot:scaffold18678_cov128-Isochrysis_galbana.AAC.3
MQKEDTRASHAPAFEACGSASTRPRVRGRHTCTNNRQHTRHPHGRSAAAPIGHQSEGRRAGHGSGSGRHRAWEQQATRVDETQRARKERAH